MKRNMHKEKMQRVRNFFQKIPKTRELWIVGYALSRDALIVALAIFPLLLIVEGVLPGFLSAHISIGQFAIATSLLALVNAFLAEKLGLSFAPLKIRHNKLIPPLATFALLLLGNAMLKFALWENLLIAATTIFILWMVMEEI